MKWLLALSITLAVMTVVSPSFGQQEDSRPGVAVLALQYGGSYGPESTDLSTLSVGLQQMLLTELHLNSALRIVERGRLAEILDEQELSSNSVINSETAVSIGRLVGARYMVLGSFVELSGEIYITARVVDTETSEIKITEKMNDDRRKLYDLLVQLATQLTEAVDLPPLPTEVQNQRRSRSIPVEAAILYSQALWAEEQGMIDRAIDILRRVAREFPQMTEARETLERLERASAS